MYASNIDKMMERIASQGEAINLRSRNESDLHRLCVGALAGEADCLAAIEAARAAKVPTKVTFAGTWLVFGSPSVGDMPREPNDLAQILRDGARSWR